jgi:hypothetical protein
VVAENYQIVLPGILPGFHEWLQPSEIKETSIINHNLTPISDNIHFIKLKCNAYAPFNLLITGTQMLSRITETQDLDYYKDATILHQHTQIVTNFYPKVHATYTTSGFITRYSTHHLCYILYIYYI